MPLFDRKDKSRYATFTRRTLVMGGGMAAGVRGPWPGRLYQLQILDGDQYMTRGRGQPRQPAAAGAAARPHPRPLRRGAGQQPAQLPRAAGGGAGQRRRRAGAGCDRPGYRHDRRAEETRPAAISLAQNKKFVPVPVAENLSWDEFARINMHLPYLPGVQPDVGETRDYPFRERDCRIFWAMSRQSRRTTRRTTTIRCSICPAFASASAASRSQFDEQVARARPGQSAVEVNAYGRVIRELGRDAGVPGQDIYLTIDREVQHFADQRLGNESAACVVMDVETGDVIALASTPGFDPNLFNVGISTGPVEGADRQRSQAAAEQGDWRGVYPPGSTFKPAVALAAVEAGIATPDYQRLLQRRPTRSGNHTFPLLEGNGGHGTLDLQERTRSSPATSSSTKRRAGWASTRSKRRRKLGMGAPTGIELPGERTGFIPSSAWKQQRYGVPWQQGETLNTGIGQGYVHGHAAAAVP